MSAQNCKIGLVSTLDGVEFRVEVDNFGLKFVGKLPEKGCFSLLLKLAKYHPLVKNQK